MGCFVRRQPASPLCASASPVSRASLGRTVPSPCHAGRFPAKTALSTSCIAVPPVLLSLAGATSTHRCFTSPGTPGQSQRRPEDRPVWREAASTRRVDGPGGPREPRGRGEMRDRPQTPTFSPPTPASPPSPAPSSSVRPRWRPRRVSAKPSGPVATDRRGRPPLDRLRGSSVLLRLKDRGDRAVGLGDDPQAILTIEGAVAAENPQLPADRKLVLGGILRWEIAPISGLVTTEQVGGGSSGALHHADGARSRYQLTE